MAMATSTAATWGSAPSMGDSTTDPSDDEFQDCADFESTFLDDDEFPIGPASANDQELSHEEENKDENKEASDNAFQSNLEVDIAGEDLEVPSKRPRRSKGVLLAAIHLVWRTLPAGFRCPFGARWPR